MVYTLTNAEKADIISQRLKTLESSKFHYEINLVEELAVPEPKTVTVDDLELQLSQINLKISAVLLELAKVQ
jgi:hypothetical protein